MINDLYNREMATHYQTERVSKTIVRQHLFIIRVEERKGPIFN
jgi:hypothetical protein